MESFDFEASNVGAYHGSVEEKAASSDRAIREYCERIWDAKPVPVALE